MSNAAQSVKLTHYKVLPDGRLTFGGDYSRAERARAGVYDVSVDYMDNVYLRAAEIAVADETVRIEDPKADRVLQLAERFLSGKLRDKLTAAGLVHKMSILLHGHHGTGKSFTLKRVVDRAVALDAVVLTTRDPNDLYKAVKSIREVEPDRLVVVVWEEFDGILGQHGEENVMQLLDGNQQIPDALYLMTTNNIDALSGRMLLRYRRIQFQFRFDKPEIAQRVAYFRAKIQSVIAEGTADFERTVATYAQRTKGLTLDQCAQVVLGVTTFGLTLDEVLTDLRERLALSGAEVEE